MLDLEIQKKITTITIFGHENLMKCCLYLHFTVNTSYFFPHAFTVDMYILGGNFKWVSYVPIKGYSFQFFRYAAGSYILHTKRYNILYIIKIQCTSLNCKKS